MESLLKLIPSFVEGKSAKLALAAVVIDTILAAFILIILSGTSFSADFTLRAAPYPYVFIAMYVIFFFVIWFILYIQDRAENDDGFSSIRKKLIGMWIVDYGSPYGINGDRRVAKSAVGCSISINPDNRKLELKFRIKDNRIYTDDEAQIIKIISLRRDHEYFYNLFYYFKGVRTLQRDILDFIEPELGHHSGDTVEVEFLARVTFECPLNVNKVARMEGEWYDLNGNISKLLALLAEIDHAKEASGGQSSQLSRRPLSDIGVPAFSASMGSIIFSRDVSAS